MAWGLSEKRWNWGILLDWNVAVCVCFLPFCCCCSSSFLFFAHHAPLGMQLVSSCVAIMRQPARGDIYIRCLAWRADPAAEPPCRATAVLLLQPWSTPSSHTDTHTPSTLTLLPAELPDSSAISPREQDLMPLKTICLVWIVFLRMTDNLRPADSAAAVCWTLFVALFLSEIHY